MEMSEAIMQAAVGRHIPELVEINNLEFPSWTSSQIIRVWQKMMPKMRLPPGNSGSRGPMTMVTFIHSR